ncbi:hypothetical protein AB833_00465 [Chromatiales bacterium (ex Bugula neritina AB1)]|nr:hypothetical protein AB833_00465 [Chromatiales bacterium (ex Bugula neritina AB1)]
MKQINPRIRRRAVRQLLILPIGAIAAIAYYLLQSAINGETSTPGRLLETAAVGMLVALLASMFEVLFLPSRAGASVRRMPFLSQLIIRIGIMCSAILAGLTLGNYFFNSAVTPDYWQELSILTDLAVAFVISLCVLLFLLMRDLVGQSAFTSFVLGRYFQPVSEFRVFMFLDLVNSTSIAQQLGDRQTHALISQFFFDIATPLIEHEGETHRYIGDEIVVTWSAKTAFRNNNCVNAVFAIEDEIARVSHEYSDRFNLVPEFRAALHCGMIAAGECGEEKREIVYFGDTVNTTARIQSLCRPLNRKILISSAVLDNLSPQNGIKFERLGPQAIRGRDEAIELFAPARDIS